MSACSDDIDIYRGGTSQGSDCISFSIEEADVWVANGTRSDDAPGSDAPNSTHTLPSPLTPEIIPLNNPDGDPLYLHVSAIPTSVYNASLAAETRGSQKNELKEDDKVGLIAIRHRADETLDYNTATIIETYLVKNGENWVPASDELRWKGNCQYDFYAYYPYEGNHKSFTISTKTTDKNTNVTTYHAPALTYTNQTKAADDCDILVAKVSTSDAEHNSSPGAINLKMTHPLSAIKFKTADEFRSCKIRGLNLSASTGFQSSATLNFDNYNTYLGKITKTDSQEDAKEAAKNTWQTTEKTPTSNFSLDFHDATEAQSANNNLPQTDAFTDDQPIYIIPTEVNLGCIPTVNLALEFFKENGDSYILGAPDAGLSVPNYIVPGYTTTYVISNSGDAPGVDAESDFVAPETVEVSYAGGDFPIDVRSIIKYQGIDIPVGWKAEVVTDDSNYISDESEISVTTTSGGGIHNVCQTIVNIGHAPLENDFTHLENLWKATPKGSSDAPYDLSTNGGLNPMSTANCYIVNAAGHYKFPLIYGNAITNGDKLGEDCGIGKTNFRDYSNHDIKTEKIVISESNYTDYPLTAKLLWHDATTLGNDKMPVEGRSDSQIITVEKEIIRAENEEECDYVQFYISESHQALQQANAVIAVGYNDKENKFKILWSWHIWITDYNPYKETIECKNTLKKGSTYYAFRYPLGYCDGPGTENYKAREFEIKLTQDITGEICKVKIKQKPFYRAANNNVVMYQARRKDPFIAATGESEANARVYETTPSGNNGYLKKAYCADGYSFKFSDGYQKISNAIKNPMALNYTKSGDDLSWFDPNEESESEENYRYDLWNIAATGTATSTTTQKTIYDPCPPGFMVPPSSFWKIWIDDSAKSSNDWKPYKNVVEDQSLIKTNRGIWLWSHGVVEKYNEVLGRNDTVPADSGEKIFLSANGRRKNGAMDRVGSYCMYWDSGSGSNSSPQKNGRFWADTKDAKYDNWGSSAGASILPVAEP